MQPLDRLAEELLTKHNIYAHTTCPFLTTLRAPLKIIDSAYVDLNADCQCFLDLRGEY